MGTTAALLSSGSRQLNKTAQATADNTGAATFKFDSPELGTIWSGTMSCPSAPPSATFAASIALQQWCEWVGEATAGPVQIFANQNLTITAAGLSPGTTYAVVLIGSEDESTNPPAAVWPDPTSSNAISIAGATLVGIITNGVSGVTTQVTVPVSARTLLVYVNPTLPANSVTNLNVSGTVPNVAGIGGGLFSLYSQTPYLSTSRTSPYGMSLSVVPLPVNMTSVGIQPTITGGGNFGALVYADSAEYTESIFYNGPVQVGTTTVVGTTTIATGPLRLLTIDLSCGVNPATCSASIGGTIVASTSGGTGTTLAGQHDYPQPFIVPAGVAVAAVTTTQGRVSATWAYP